MLEELHVRVGHGYKLKDMFKKWPEYYNNLTVISTHPEVLWGVPALRILGSE